MNDQQPVILEKKDRYAIIRINKPKSLNALDAEILTALYDTVEDLVQDTSIRAMLITGNGEKAFVAGADIAAMQDMNESQADDFARAGHRTMNAINQAEILSIAVINGFALGGGLELALACDMRLAADNAKMGLPEVTLGLIPGFGGTQRLPRVVGKGIAMEMILGGDMIDAKRAYEIGLVNALYPQASLMAEAEQFVSKMIKHKSIHAQKTARWAIQSGLDVPLPAGLAKEITFFGELFGTPDPKKGMNAFLNKQKPDF